jgi:hypothetical protein
MLTTISITMLPETWELLQKLTELQNKHMLTVAPDYEPLTPEEYLGGSLQQLLQRELEEFTH